MESKLKLLEMTQAVINRMSSNSFVFKGWSVTIVAGLSAFATTDSNKKLLLVALSATILLWAVDAYYLSFERQYRKLYEKIAKQKPETIDFSLKLPAFPRIRSWICALKAPILIGFYGSASLLILITAFLIKVW